MGKPKCEGTETLDMANCVCIESEPGLRELSDTISNLTTNKVIGPSTEAHETLKSLSTLKKSFSPQVNQLLSKLDTASSRNILGCGSEEILVRSPDSFTLKGELKVLVHGKCMRWSSKSAQQRMLSNLNADIEVDCRQVIAPKQSLSNCWFNTFFVAFFVSDRGRKFFRFFRELMILGKHADGTPIKNRKLAKALFLLNLCVDCSLNPTWWSEVPQMGRLLDTNNIIYVVANAIGRTNPKSIKGIREWGNPLRYYLGIKRFLEGEKNNQMPGVSINIYSNSVPAKAELSDLIIVDNNPSQKASRKRLEFKRQGRVYKLDSVIIRDITKSHFSACLTCNDSSYVFDGASFMGIKKFDWRSIINSSRQWKTGRKSHVFSFTESYSMWFYYRMT